MGKSVWRSVEYFFTGNYVADDDDNKINAIGFGGVIHAYGGNDQITVGSIGATVYTGTGDDIVNAGAAYLKVVDDSGVLAVRGAAGYAEIEKSQSGNIDFSGLSGAVTIRHDGHGGDIHYQGAALANLLARRGFSGGVIFSGAGGYNQISHHTDNGDLRFNGAGAANQLERRWFQRYQGSSGDIFFTGAGAANIITSTVESGRVNLHGAGAYNRVLRQGREGDIDFRGMGGWNELSRLCHDDDVFQRTHGDIHFSGAGGYNRIISDVANGNIHFKGGGGFNHITRRGGEAGNPLASARADTIRLISGTLGGEWVNQQKQVSAIKSTVRQNTYIFAIFDDGYTKINQVELLNDPASGALRYVSTSWYRAGDHINQLSDMHISEQTGFTPTQINGVGGAYSLTGLSYEHQKAIHVQAIESEVKKDQWVSYGGGIKQEVNNIEIISARIGSVGESHVDSGVTVDAVRSVAQPNCYIFARFESNYTNVVRLELVNDGVTGEIRYRTSAWRKLGNNVSSIAEETVDESNGYSALDGGEYEISDLHYQINTVRALPGMLPQVKNYSVNDFAERSRREGNTQGNINFEGAGGGNLIESDVTRGDIHFSGAGAANIVIKKGQQGDLVFRGAGLANVLLHLGAQGRMDVYAAGAANVLIRRGDGNYLARLLAYGNISVHHGDGDGQVLMLGGANAHTHIGRGREHWLAAGGFNALTKVGSGAVDAVMAGGGNVLSVLGGGDLSAGLLGGANVVSHIHQGSGEADTRVIALGGANVLTKYGDGKLQAMLGGQLNVLTHIGQGEAQAIMLGAANVLTKVGDGDLSAVMLAWGNVLSHVGDGRTLGVMAAAGNIFTKVGDGTSIAAMVGAGNVFTHIGQGDAWALMGGVLNVFTKVGDGKALALMIAKGNIFTHVGNGLTVALMLAKGNVATKVGDGMTLAAMIGGANVFSQIGHGETFAAMIGKANVLTRVGDGLTAALMAGKANVFTQVGHGISLGLFAGDFNLMTKVGDGSTLAAAFGNANVMTHVGSGITGVLALGKANIVTKVGDGLLGVLAKAEANVVTHVGNGVTAALLLGKGNVLTKVGNGATVGLLVSDVGNVLTQVGDGLQIGFAKGKANLMTKVGAGDQIVAAWGELNVLTHVGDGLGVRAAKGRANVLSKIGQGGQLSIVQGEANVVTHIGDGDDYVGAWGRANVVTKVGAGRQVTLAKGEANIITQVGQGDGYQALLGRANLVTKVGDGIQVTAAKGEANVVTTVGDGLSVTAVYGKLNSNIKVGSGTSVNVAWGDYNLNTQWGDGLNVAVMKGKGNANIQIGDGLMISAAYARNNVVVKVGNGDFYSLAVASSNTASNKLAELFGNIKQTLLGAGASQAINYLVQGDEGETSGVSRQGRGGFRLPGRQSRTGAEEEALGVELTEVQQLQGFRLDEIGQTDSSLASDLRGQISRPQDVDEEQHASRLSIEEQGAGQTNLIVNGDFEQYGHGWQSTHGIEAWLGAGVYGLSAEAKYGQFSSELSTDRNTTIYQDLDGLRSGQTITLDFDFARRLHAGLEHGIEVRWNNVLVFSSQGDAAEWQHKQLQLAAVTGRNRISFSGTGPENSLGYVIDNVAAYAVSMPDLNVPGAGAQVSQDQAAAERDQQHLEQEKERQLANIEGSLRQLEASDEQQLSRNGDWLRDVLSEEAEAVTSRLGQLTRGLESFATQRQEGGSGHAWRDRFAGELPEDVQEQLARAQTAASDALNSVDQQHQRQQAERQAALQKSERGRRRSEEARLRGQDQAQAATAQGSAQASQAQTRQQQAQGRQEQAKQDAEQARQRGAQAAEESRQKVSQAASDAKSVQQQGDAKPERVVRSATVVEPQRADAAERDEATEAGEVDEFDGEAGGTENPGQIAPELVGLADARAAVNRLQINAGLRARSRSYLGKAQPVRQAPASRDEGGVAGDLEALGKDGDAGDVPADQVLQRQVSTIRDQMEPGSQAIKELRIGVSFRTDGNGKAHIEHDLKAIESLNQLKNKNGDPLFPFKIVPVTLPVGASGPMTPPRDATWSDLDNINLLYIPGAPTASDIQIGSSSPSSPSHQEELNLNRPVRPEPPSMPEEPIAPESLASKKQQNRYKSQLEQYKKQLDEYQRQLAQYETQIAKYERINGEHQSRSAYELRLLDIARARGIPIMAVCAGSWRLLELYGGEVRTLRRSHSRDQHKASNPAQTWKLEHELRLMDGKVLSQLTETQEGGDSKITGINSTHWAAPTYDDTPEGRKLRSGIGVPSRWLSISAEDPDTLTVEAFESRNGVPVMGLQWHPEAYLPGMPGEMSGTEEARALSYAIFEYMVFSAQTAQQRAELVASLKKHFEQRMQGDTSKPNRVPDTEELESLGAMSGLRSERQGTAEEVEKTPLDGLITRQALQQEASVFAKRIGPSYRAILDGLERLPTVGGDTQLAEGLALHQRLSSYLAEHPTSGRNPALGRLRAQLEEKLFAGDMLSRREDLLAVAKESPQLAVRLYQLARETARSGDSELTTAALAWARADSTAALARLNALVDAEPGKTWRADRGELASFADDVRRATGRVVDTGDSHALAPSTEATHAERTSPRPSRASSGRVEFIDRLMQQPDADLERFLLRKNPELKPLCDYVFRDVDLPDGRFGRITSQFVSKQHLLAFSVASNLGNFAVSAREAGALTLERLADGAAAKGHDILEKTVKGSSLSSAYGAEGAQKLAWLQELGLAGLVGHWDPETKALLGFYVTPELYAQRDSADEAERAVGQRVLRVDADHYYFPVDISDAASIRSSTALLRESPQWQQKMYTGDYDLHDMVSFSGRAHSVPSSSQTERFIRDMLNAAVAAKDESRPLRRGSHHTVQHGPQVSYPAHMGAHEQGVPLVGAVANPSFPLALCDRGVWQPIVHDVDQLQGAYRRMGAHLKVTWQPGEDHLRFVPDGENGQVRMVRRPSQDSGGGASDLSSSRHAAAEQGIPSVESEPVVKAQEQHGELARRDLQVDIVQSSARLPGLDEDLEALGGGRPSRGDPAMQDQSIQRQAVIYAPFVAEDMITQGLGINLTRQENGKSVLKMIALDEQSREQLIQLRNEKVRDFLEKGRLYPESVKRVMSEAGISLNKYCEVIGKQEIIRKSNEGGADYLASVQKAMREKGMNFEQYCESLGRNYYDIGIGAAAKWTHQATVLQQMEIRSNADGVELTRLRPEYDRIYVIGHGGAGMDILAADSAVTQGRVTATELARQFSEGGLHRDFRDIRVATCHSADTRSPASFSTPNLERAAQVELGPKKFGFFGRREVSRQSFAQSLSSELYKLGYSKAGITGYHGAGVTFSGQEHRTRRLVNEEGRRIGADVRASEARRVFFPIDAQGNPIRSSVASEDRSRQRSAPDAEDASADSLNMQGLGGTHERVESSRLDSSTELAQWRTEQVTSPTRGETASRFDGQLIFQMENDPVAARAAARLAGKHPGKSVLVQVGADGQYRVVHGELSSLSGKLRWQVVGHGREDGEAGNSRLSGYDADSLAARLLHVSNNIARAHGIETQAEHVSLVGCSLVGSSRQDGYARGFFEAMERRGAVASVSARSSEVAVDSQGRKHTRAEQGDWRRKEAERKVVFSRGEDQQLQVRRESIRSGIAEGDINLARVGQSRRASASGAIADNQDVFQAPKKRVATNQEGDASSDSGQLSYSGNIQLQLGDGEFTTVNWGTSNLGIKVGAGGMKSLVFGDNNVMVHIGDGDSQHSVDIAGYRALEGAQLFIGNRNVSFNLGRSNDLIVMADKSIPMPPLVNPFDGAAHIAGVLQTIAGNRDQSQWLGAQWAQWTQAGVEKYLADTAGLDQTSSVDYASLADLDSQHQRSSRGLKSDIEATLNKKFNQWQSSQGQQGGGQLSRADKLRQMNEKLAFNFAVGGQGADIQITTANWNFVFGDNIQSILDTNLGSLFGLLTQQFTATGMAKTTFTFTPTDLPRQLQNRLMGRLAGVGSDTTLGDIFGVDYTAQGGLVSRSGEAIDAPAILREMLSVIADFGGEQLASFTDPARWLDALAAGAALGKDALRTFARSHGLQAAAPDETDDVSPPADALAAAETDRKAFGLNALHLPNLFATLFSQDKQSEMKQLLSNLKQNLSADLLNMQEQTFDFLRNSGHLQGDGDMHVSLGNYNFNWGGDGKDLGAYLGENNNFWGGRGDDVFYATGTSNVFSGGAGSDTGVLMGRENMMFGGEGDDVAVLAGRINHAYLGDGNDQAYVFGEGGVIDGAAGQDYLVVSGNYNSMDGGAGQDFVVAIGNHNQISLGQGNDYAVVFGNHNRLQADHGRNQIKLMGYHALVTGADEGDHLIADSASKFSEFSAGAGDDVLVLGGYQNRFSGGGGVNSFVLSDAVIDCEVLDIEQDDYIVLDDIDQQDIWFKRNGDDLQILLNRCDETAEASDQDRFEQIGTATFNEYFSNKRAKIVLELGDIQKKSLRSYTALSHQAVDVLVQAMSGFTPEAGQAGFISNIDRASSQAVQAAWSMVVQGDGKLIV
ncbi:MARTX multifunctional-autoprocessing repeats-in-toxin holotoxin RtxA [Chromobacterium amazonense]|uniref:MARTX multifunctional-autoprocessing repeats-in-toxin holotoxin RtxA n=1 Tax=Chromobacterium amazonense TaxID=1382803 RepID=A0ABU8V3I5_9NEIS|nr:MARTX multifunctional-autoprocessing repeats-in-toxin holotoxin RtxA [Chromobacterium amazonense]MDQ4540699.1 MARTX multifunctional-autoprocessing repeats-in-toxin holotoxin RtxA [Chromobacterium amazonense]